MFPKSQTLAQQNFSLKDSIFLAALKKLGIIFSGSKGAFLMSKKYCGDRDGLRDRGARGRKKFGAPKLWNAKTTNIDLGRARKSLGATDLVNLNDKRHNNLYSNARG